MDVLNTGIQGAKWQSYQSGPKQIFRRIKTDNRGIDLDEMRQLFFDAVRNDDDALRFISDYWVTNYWNYDAAEVSRKKLAARKQETKERAEKYKEQVKTTIRQRIRDLLPETIMSMTFRDLGRMVKAAPKLAALIPLGKPSEIVGDKVSLAKVKKALR